MASDPTVGKINALMALSKPHWKRLQSTQTLGNYPQWTAQPGARPSTKAPIRKKRTEQLPQGRIAKPEKPMLPTLL
ncbi:hypothetical protein DPMN_032415 [Dreissena polymorpha]|uniref:Uncharacterized protein n=1 Tax=Dreissena polymorpha TaxID=45954 RepID=A0A9D4RHY1_DREPO|nr:hypothetical protein DPMN_032415 [Dreissena polymorpha]